MKQRRLDEIELRDSDDDVSGSEEESALSLGDEMDSSAVPDEVVNVEEDELDPSVEESQVLTTDPIEQQCEPSIDECDSELVVFVPIQEGSDRKKLVEETKSDKTLKQWRSLGERSECGFRLKEGLLLRGVS